MEAKPWGGRTGKRRFLVALGLSNAERSAANEAMIAEIPKVAFF